MTQPVRRIEERRERERRAAEEVAPAGRGAAEIRHKALRRAAEQHVRERFSRTRGRRTVRCRQHTLAVTIGRPAGASGLRSRSPRHPMPRGTPQRHQMKEEMDRLGRERAATGVGRSTTQPSARRSFTVFGSALFSLRYEGCRSHSRGTSGTLLPIGQEGPRSCKVVCARRGFRSPNYGEFNVEITDCGDRVAYVMRLSSQSVPQSTVCSCGNLIAVISAVVPVGFP